MDRAIRVALASLAGLTVVFVGYALITVLFEWTVSQLAWNRLNPGAAPWDPWRPHLLLLGVALIVLVPAAWRHRARLWAGATQVATLIPALIVVTWPLLLAGGGALSRLLPRARSFALPGGLTMPATPRLRPRGPGDRKPLRATGNGPAASLREFGDPERLPRLRVPAPRATTARSTGAPLGSGGSRLTSR